MCSVDVLRTMPSKAIELASFDLYKKAFGSLRPKGADGKRHPSGLGVTVAGALAGVPHFTMWLRVLTTFFSDSTHVVPCGGGPKMAGELATGEVVTQGMVAAAV